MPIERSILVDGGAKSKLWREILTDVSGLHMTYIERAPGAPLGDALLAGVGTGVLEDYNAIKDWLEETEITKPNPSNKKLYDEYYTLFRRIYETNTDIHKELRKITSLYES